MTYMLSIRELVKTIILVYSIAIDMDMNFFYSLWKFGNQKSIVNLFCTYDDEKSWVDSLLFNKGYRAKDAITMKT